MKDERYDELIDMTPITSEENAEILAGEVVKLTAKIKDLTWKNDNLKEALKEWGKEQYEEQEPDRKGKKEPVKVGGVTMSFAKDTLNQIPFDDGKEIKAKFDDNETWKKMLTPVWKPVRGCVDVFDSLTKAKKKLFKNFIKEGSGRLTS